MSSSSRQPARSIAVMLRKLEEKLPEGVLTACLPDMEPRKVRADLLKAASILAGDSAASPAKKDVPPPIPKGAARSGKTLVLFTDGAARGNPGEAAAGVSIQDADGGEIYGHGTYLGQCTNNVAEYRALILGLKTAAQFKPEQLDIFMDSELIVKQVKGLYRVKNENLKPLFKEVKELLAGFNSFKIAHVRREKNKRADELANQAIDQQHS